MEDRIRLRRTKDFFQSLKFIRNNTLICQVVYEFLESDEFDKRDTILLTKEELLAFLRNVIIEERKSQARPVE